MTPHLQPPLPDAPDADAMQALQAANARLQAEVAAHEATLRQLHETRCTLEQQVAERVEDLRFLNARFTTGLRNSAVTLVEQDEQLRYTWVFNPPADLDPDEMVGHRGEDYAAPSSIAAIEALRREALSTGEVREGEIEVHRLGRTFWYQVQVQPTRLRDGAPGVVTTSVDITALKRQQDHLRLITRELNHRSKNLLTIVQSIARQTAAGTPDPGAFLSRLEERLGSLAAAHDVLARDDWRGADLAAVVESQLKHQLLAFDGRIRLAGARLDLGPDMAHYLGLAVHELGANAAKHGALSADGGRVEVEWSGDGEAFRLDWRESGGPAVTPPPPGGFGRTILEFLAPRALAGRAELRFDPAGVSWSLEAPLRVPQIAQAPPARRA